LVKNGISHRKHAVDRVLPALRALVADE
jgi:hypothetical protein